MVNRMRDLTIRKDYRHFGHSTSADFFQGWREFEKVTRTMNERLPRFSKVGEGKQVQPQWIELQASGNREDVVL